MSKMCIAEIDAKLDDDNLGEAGKARPEAGRNRRVRRQEKAERGGVMPPCASYGQASTWQGVGNE